MYIGIDLGTTNSVISFAQIKPNGQVGASPIDIDRVTDSGTGLEGRVSYVRDRRKTLPSCVYYGQHIFVGDYAREQYKKYPGSVVKSVKSQMGEPVLRGYPDVPDKTPEEVSARILEHLKRFAEQQIRAKITDVIITVPANFDAAQREATMKAAEKAGFTVRDEMGRWKPILISEPNAVLYDLAQRILNGDVADTVLDLSSRRRVMVFDIGGGTLDVTFHELERDSDNAQKLNISEIASSRYTKLAGDDFDNEIAERLYERCIQKLQENEPAAVQRVAMRKPIIKKMLAVAAEKLKIDMSIKAEGSLFSSSDSWFDEVESSDDVEISHSIGDERIYNDTITKEEFEEMVSAFMGYGLTYDDYHNYSQNKAIDRHTIIAPVLDVLEKAERYYSNRGESDFKVDAVVLNGGMSKLYLIKDRLRDFFGFEPVTTADPDLSVANGAAVYSCILSKFGAPKEPGEKSLNLIEIVRHIQNDNLYLGLSAGAADPLITEGTVLPYSTVIDGYRLQPGADSIEIPIKRGVDIGDMPTIARGKITFKKPDSGAKLKIEADFDQTGLISIKAHLAAANDVVLETGSVEISLGESTDKVKGGEKLRPRDGAKLNPSNELFALRSLYSVKTKNYKEFKKLKARIEGRIATITSCGNPADFAEGVVKYLAESGGVEFKIALYQIAGEIGETWSEKKKAEFREVAHRDVIDKKHALNINAQRIKLSDSAEDTIKKLSTI